MVGLGDIPCVGTFVERISNKTVDAVFRGFRYVFRYKALVDQLNSETAKLNIQMDKMSMKVEEEKNNGKIIEDYVLTWQDKVEDSQKTGETLSPSCSCIQCLPIPNPVSRFRIGRNAAKKAIAVAQLTGTGNDYLDGEIAHLPPFENMPQSDTAFEEFKSRKEAYGKLWKGLVNKDSPLVHGLYGMAGVGKTRMMEKIWEDAMKKKIFDKVVRINVGSEKLNETNLQDQIADRLNCKLESQDMERRASQLENSLRNGEKILLILDDVWREISLGHITGTLFKDGSSSNGSKILLTSREKEACLLNHCEHPVEVKTLSHNEALDLFMKTVGPDTINSLPDQSLVKEVCDECGQLPLLILAVGKALKRKRHNSWVDALVQLQKGKFRKIPGVNPRVYAGIKLSIDHLEHDDAKSCLFLCCLFPEDANIDMKLLIQLATGSQLIRDGESRVLAMVDSLKESSLLLDSGEYHKTKVHDIIRDVARDVAFSEYAFLQVTCNSEYLPPDDNYCTRKLLRLDAGTADVYFHEDLVCPDLHTLWLQSNNHPQRFLGGFFRMFGNLRLLTLQNVKISLEKFSLVPLGNLRTLILLKCNIRKTDVSLFPKKLETLCISGCKLPMPMDVANLDNLRKLEIQAGSKLVMKSNVIPSLSRLEELHVPNGFIIDLEKYEINPIVMEISELTRLKSLQFHFYDDHTFQGRNVFPDIDRYNIFVGEPIKFVGWKRYSEVPLGRVIKLCCHQLHSWEGLMARAEEVKLGYSDFQVSSICNGHRRAFEHLKRQYIESCDMGYLAGTSQDEIQNSLQHGATSFSKLTILEIVGCSKLKYLFCNNTAKSLIQLQQLSVDFCVCMKAIIMNQSSSDGKIINFPKLKSLKILRMRRLASFYMEEKDISTVPMDNSARHQPFFDGTAAFPCLEKLFIYGLPNISVIWGKDCFNNDNASSFCKLTSVQLHYCHKLEIAIPQAMLHRLNNLEYVDVCGCSSLRTMFSFVARDLTHLKKLEVTCCMEMREIVEAGESAITDNGLLFPEMTDLSLRGLPSLRSFWCYQSGKAKICRVPLTLPQLSSITLDSLPKLRRLFHGANFEFHAPALKQEQVNVCRCPLLEHIFEDVRVDKTSDMSAKTGYFSDSAGESERIEEVESSQENKTGYLRHVNSSSGHPSGLRSADLVTPEAKTPYDCENPKESESPRFQAILRVTSAPRVRFPADIKSFSHELNSKGVRPFPFGKPRRSNNLEEVQVMIRAKFDKAKEEVDSDLCIFAAHLVEILDKNAESHPEWQETIEDLLILARQCAMTSAGEFWLQCEGIGQELDDMRQELPMGILKQLHTRMLFILTRCTRLLHFHKESGFAVLRSWSSRA